ncbi:hypothetical protein DJ568_02655 [Mucilaginibacter hurinus]|uniref:Uncharacterized protein n=1 Tax=Mucilaginibacter hurinus TaxID=2201324 RepID=A0A367GTN2_9SPHI|nr:hypothetical protein [Mucilaginibacter hurinus]RCH56774.1 hypothetical protein DJ568_02655 [Mucilaginibacter hurinus]
MKVLNFKIFVALLFITIFFAKMVISIAPVGFRLDNKVVRAVILQLENETKSDKDTTEKDIVKEKKTFDEYYSQLVRMNTHVVEMNILHNQENLIYHNIYYPSVLTPPPNV